MGPVATGILCVREMTQESTGASPGQIGEEFLEEGNACKMIMHRL